MHNLIPVPPGATIAEQLIEKKMLRGKFAQLMGMNKNEVADLLSGASVLTDDIAERLESVLGVPANFWINLESIYRDKLRMAQNSKASN